MACATPVVATTGGALPEVAGPDGDAALLVAAGRPAGAGRRDRPGARRPRAAGPARGRRVGTRVVERFTWRGGGPAYGRGLPAGDRASAGPGDRGADGRLRPAPVAPGDRVLDLGCGAGRHAFECYRRGRPGGRARPQRRRRGRGRRDVRRDAEAGEAPTPVRPLGDGRRRAPPAVPRRRLRRGRSSPRSWSTSPTTGASSPRSYRVLRPGGTLAVTVPRWWPERICWALSDAYHEVEGGHIRIYRRRQLLARLRAQALVPRRHPSRPRAALAVLVAQVPVRHRTTTRRCCRSGCITGCWSTTSCGGHGGPGGPSGCSTRCWARASWSIWPSRNRRDARRPTTGLSRAAIDQTGAIHRGRPSCPQWTDPVVPGWTDRSVGPHRGRDGPRRRPAGTTRPGPPTTGCAGARIPTAPGTARTAATTVVDPVREANFAAYLAVGLLHHIRSTGDDDVPGPDVADARARRSTSSSACRRPAGRSAGPAAPDGRSPPTRRCSPAAPACSTACAARWSWPGCATSRSRTGSWPRPRSATRSSRTRNGSRPGSRYSMDWYYPILGGALRGPAAHDRIDGRLGPVRGARPRHPLRRATDPGSPAPRPANWCSRCARSATSTGPRELFADMQHLRHDDGSYWTGYVYPDDARWPRGADHLDRGGGAARLGRAGRGPGHQAVFGGGRPAGRPGRDPAAVRRRPQRRLTRPDPTNQR